MRKFRAVDLETNQVYDGDRIEADDSIIITLSYGELVAFYVSIGGDYEDLKLNQWTGLLDKNEQEIYEGDILKVPVDGNKELHGSYSLQEVLFKNGTYITSYLVSEKGQILPRGYTAGFLLDHFDFENKSFLFNEKPYMDTEIEIVGNVFENPELYKELME